MRLRKLLCVRFGVNAIKTIVLLYGFIAKTQPCKRSLTVKMKKCKFGLHECSYLEHRIGSGGIRPEEVKLEAIKNMPIPMTKKDVRSFLGSGSLL